MPLKKHSKRRGGRERLLPYLPECFGPPNGSGMATPSSKSGSISSRSLSSSSIGPRKESGRRSGFRARKRAKCSKNPSSFPYVPRLIEVDCTRRQFGLRSRHVAEAGAQSHGDVAGPVEDDAQTGRWLSRDRRADRLGEAVVVSRAAL